MTAGAIGPWQLCATPAGEVDGPAALERANVAWIDTPTATTSAAALRAAGVWSLDGPPRRFDAEDWWWRARVPAGAGVFGLDGLATLADVYLDGALVLTSDNMFRRHELPVPATGANLLIRFRSLDAALAARRPRPRWRAPMIEHQQLRWFRTTLLGRTPGWSPPAAPVGPWRGVRLGPRPPRPRTRLEGTTGVVELVGHEPVRIPDVHRWWPHTHGEPVLYPVRFGELEVKVGFRELALDHNDGGFGLRVNGVSVFCRGACWTPIDPVALSASRDATRAALLQARNAGMNMLRVGGTMVYESDDFLDLADELGILVWQDLMFANMDYPENDDFVAGIGEEVRQELARWQGRPSLAIVCGNSEGEQQAAMWGAPRELWSPRLFHETLPAIVAEAAPEVPYWPSSAHGGAFPHAADTGTTSYYGVGAYLRPLQDARRAGVRFATECLAFANVPSPRALERLAPSVRAHHPAWKARTPRDLGAGWDFDDVRDHYLSQLFRCDPAALRYADHERYLALGRITTGEVMAATFAEWRRASSTCRGGLLWFLRDLWNGAGWGVIDAAGEPKAAYHYCRRALAPLAVHLSDEGGNGLTVHLVNDGPAPVIAELELSLWRDGEVSVGRARRSVELAPHRSLELAAASLLDGFVDLTYAYRFGPPPCDLVIATLIGTDAQAFHFPLGLPNSREPDLGLTATVLVRDDGDVDVVVRTRRFAQSIAVDFEGFAPDDDFFHLAPGAERTIRLRRRDNRPAKGTLLALNSASALAVR